jgi:hypothetical protein
VVLQGFARGYRSDALEKVQKYKISINELVLRERIELSTSPLPRECSTTELPQLSYRSRANSEPPSAATFAIALALTQGRGLRCSRHASTRNQVNIQLARFETVPMTDFERDEIPPHQTGSPRSETFARHRLAEALRANLERRKAQKRARLGVAAQNEPTETSK